MRAVVTGYILIITGGSRSRASGKSWNLEKPICSEAHLTQISGFANVIAILMILFYNLKIEVNFTGPEVK